MRPASDLDAGKLGVMITDAAAANTWKPVLHSGAEDIAHAGQMIEFGWVTVAEDDDGQIAGFIARDKTYVHALFIAPYAQGQGVGGALLDHAKSQVAQLDLWTFQANKGAQRFYKRNGFSEVEFGDGSQNEEGLPDVHFVWSKQKAKPPVQQPATPVPNSDHQNENHYGQGSKPAAAKSAPLTPPPLPAQPQSQSKDSPHE